MNELQVFDKLKAEITTFVQPVKDMVVNSKETQVSVTEFLKTVKSYSKRIEEKRVELVTPLNNKVKEVNAYAKDLDKPLDDAEKMLKSQLLKWSQELERIRQEEIKKAEAEKKRLEEEARLKAEKEKANAQFEADLGLVDQASQTALTAQITEERETKSIEKSFKKEVKAIEQNKVKGVREVWKFEVVDENLVPKDFLIVDETAVTRAVRNGVREIAGIRIYSEKVLAV